MNRLQIILLIVIAALVAFAIFGKKSGNDYRDVSFMVSGQEVSIGSDFIYFGNEIRKDLDGDGREDVAFLVTQDISNGDRFFIVGAYDTGSGWVGGEAVMLGDNIAPQTTESGESNSVIVNYAIKDGAGNASIAKTSRILLDRSTGRYGEIVQDFEGESATLLLTRKPWTWVSALYNDGKTITPKQAGTFVLTFSKDGRFSATTDCNHLSGGYVANTDSILFSDIAMTKMFCEGSQETDFVALLQNSSDYHFTEEGSLILDLKFDSGTATFK